MRTILCIDDDNSMWDSVRAIFEGNFKVFISGDVPQAREILKSEKIDLILLDYAMPGTDGLTFLSELSRTHSEIPVLMVTGIESDYTLAEALRRGARGRITKPFNVAEIRHHVQQALASLEVPKMRAALEKESEAINPNLIADSPSLQGTITRAIDLKKFNAPIFMTGERGVGKELLARYTHNVNRRTQDIFYVVRCGGNEGELALELFGTDAQPGILRTMTGTIFFDDVNRLSKSALERLAEFVGAKAMPHAPFLVLASHDLKGFLEEAPTPFAEIAKARTVEISPLRDRADDIPVLAYRLLTDLAKRFNNQLIGFTPESLRLMRSYAWPGNIRELQNVVDRLALIYGQFPEVESSFLPREICPIPQRIPKFPGMSMDQTIEGFERGLILDALDKTGWNARKAAELLSTTTRKLGTRIGALKLKSERQKAPKP